MESGAAVADDVYPGTKHRGASVSFLYLLEKMERKTNHSNIFGTKTSKDSELNFDRARSTTVNSLSHC